MVPWVTKRKKPSPKESSPVPKDAAAKADSRKMLPPAPRKVAPPKLIRRRMVSPSQKSSAKKKEEKKIKLHPFLAEESEADKKKKNAEARKFLVYTFGTMDIGHTVHLDEDGSKHKQLYQDIVQMRKRIKQEAMEVNTEAETLGEIPSPPSCMTSPLPTENPDFNYSRGSFEWGCKYCGKWADQCDCITFVPHSPSSSIKDRE